MADAQAFHLVSWLILMRADGRVLLARRAPGQLGEGRWGLPGGHAHDTETLAQAAVREAWEEVGVQADARHAVPLGAVRYVDGDVRGLDVYFRVTAWRHDPYPRAECSEVAWFMPHDLPPDVLPWLPDTLPRLLDAPPGSAWLSETLH
ncbi:NUDIX hydrolase [Deinococcus aquiradiocola]|uniref:Nudix hydrolase domain-containing protein n=1 Tax=Deinococcus aquiradiocola TaxID=393059 RepID=A0A917P3Y3_9DEIO|nr:NUDIX hydrolase [Deinococcus aquiradiocola]GGJ60454.1 hypothetical protein GCM10008939_00230 [Deinococcus aquiradiocola]